MGDPTRWAVVPFHFWSAVLFLLGSIVGSFLNVCIHRLPRGESLVRPPSHCPHCGQSIPWFLNLPVASWLLLRGRCRSCSARISPRYLLVELLTAALFLACWLVYGERSVALALVYCLGMAGLVVATFIDFEHFIIPDTITIGGVAAGVLGSFLVPELQHAASPVEALQRCALGAGLGGGVIYAVVRLGKLFLGRQKFPLPPGTRVYFTEECLVLPDRTIPYAEVFYRRSDAIVLEARQVELVDRCYWNVPVRLTQTILHVGPDQFPTEQVHCLEAVTDRIVIPREAMGLGDVKFMAAIGAFLGAAGVLFSLIASAFIGSIVGVTLILAGRHQRSNPIPYGPYLALAAAVWALAGEPLLRWWLKFLQSHLGL